MTAVPARARWAALSRTRVRTGLALAVLLPGLLTVVLVPLRADVGLASDVLLYLFVTVVVALVGGLLPALVSALAGSLLLNFWLTPPLRTLAIRETDDVVALVVFVAVAVLVSLVVDLAARRRSEAARAAADAEVLAQVDAVRTALLAAVGHDLRTPLAAAKASVAGLRSSDVTLSDDDRGELLATADESIDRLAALVDDLLDMSRLQAGALSVQRVPTALEEVLARALDDLGPDADAVRVDVPGDLPLALADPGLLERVLANLLTNAVRHGASPSVTAVARDDRVEVSVVDHGPGIPPDDVERVFRPFQRLGDTDNGAGIGLGLALARGLVEGMHGTLLPHATEGGGVTMVVSLAAVADGPVTPGRREQVGP